MQEDPTPFASAPEPYAVPAATPVTSATSSGRPSGSGRRPRRTTLALVGAIVLFDLLAAGGAWFYLSPKGGAAAAVSAPAAVEAALRSRVATDYPGFTVTKVDSQQVDYSSAAGGGSEWVFYFDLRNVDRPAFAYTTRYYALLSQMEEPAAYENADEFFRVGKTPAAEVASFIRMWPFSHPGETCLDVTATGDSETDTQTCTVEYLRYESTRGSIVSTTGTYIYQYAPKTDTWIQVGSAATPESAAGDDAAVVHDPLAYDYSLADTQTAVAQGLPGFKATGVATHANGDPMIVVRHTKYPQLIMAVDGIFLDPPDPDSEDMVKLFAGDHTRADAFARMWSSAHRGTIIDMMYFDPESTGDANLLDVTYVKSVAEVSDMNFEKDVEYRYDPKAHVWTKAK